MGRVSMARTNIVEKYRSSILDGKPEPRGLKFGKRRVPQAVTNKFGKELRKTHQVDVPPVSINLYEEFMESPRNSNHPSKLAADCARSHMSCSTHEESTNTVTSTLSAATWSRGSFTTFPPLTSSGGEVQSARMSSFLARPSIQGVKRSPRSDSLVAVGPTRGSVVANPRSSTAR